MSKEDNYQQAISSVRRSKARGTDPEDGKSFSEAALEKLRIAQSEAAWLLERRYPIGGVLTLVGGHHQLTARQRMALQRATCSPSQLKVRKSKLLPDSMLSQGPLQIDGFNLIIALEVALSGGVLLLGCDETIRDLAGLRGSYHLIDKTDQALQILGNAVKKWQIPELIIWLDAPVSNSGRLKAKILEDAERWGIPVTVELVPNADAVLKKIDRVVTSDSVILDECHSWFNLVPSLLAEYIPTARIVRLNNEAIGWNGSGG